MLRCSLNLVLLLISACFPFILYADTQQPGAPIQIGGTCADADGSYLWITSTKSTWLVQDVVAVPSDIADPGSWSNTGAFHGALWSDLPGTPDASAFSEGIAAISPS